MVKVIDIEEFLKLANNDELPIIDVRSPIEYNHAHIPNAHNVYLFNDEERKDVGTIYKQIGRKEAILKGLEYVSVRMTAILKSIDEITKKYNSTNKILMHCFRGGMRSESTAWLCSSYGYDVYMLKGGYKRYRNYVLDSFERDYKIYLESQFKSYKNWGADSKATVKYPAPNMLYSERAIVAYESYIYDNQTSYQNEGYDIKAQSNNVGDYKQQVTKRVEKSIRAVLRDMKSWTSKYCTLFDNVDTEKYDLVSVMKTKSIFDRWDDPDIPCIEYLSQVPDILDLVNSKRGISDGIDSKILDLESLLGNSVKMEIVSEVVKSLEKKHKMPDFVSVSEIPNILMGSDTIESDMLW